MPKTSPAWLKTHLLPLTSTRAEDPFPTCSRPFLRLEAVCFMEAKYLINDIPESTRAASSRPETLNPNP